MWASCVHPTTRSLPRRVQMVTLQVHFTHKTPGVILSDSYKKPTMITHLSCSYPLSRHGSNKGYIIAYSLVQTGDAHSHIPTGILYPSHTLKPTSNWNQYENSGLKVRPDHTNAQFNPFFQAGKIWPNFSTPSFEKLSDHGGYWYLGC